MPQDILAIIGALVVLLIVFEMLRRRRLREKYAVLWVIVAVVTVVVAVWPQLLETMAGWVGITTPSNLLFLAAITVSFLIALQLSSEVGRLEEETRTLAEEVGMLRLKVEELTERLDAKDAERRDSEPDGQRRAS